jgi:hypothetical protein
MERVLLRERGVRRGLDADDSAFRGARLEDLVGLIRFVFQSAREPAWVMRIGRSLASIVSSDVWSPQCETSMVIPILFIRRTVAHSSVETSAHFPAGFARSRSAVVSAR